jgi:hypothetical protein
MASRFHLQSPFGAGLTEKGRDGGLLALGSVAVVMGGSWTRPDRLAVSSRLAMLTKSFGFMTCGRLYVYETLLERLAQDLQDVAAELRLLIQKENPVVRQRHVAWPRHLAPADQPDVRDGVMGGAKRASRHQRGAVAGEAGNTMDACGLNGFGQGHRRQDGGESPCQHRLASPRGAEQEDVVVTTPASALPSTVRLSSTFHTIEKW